MKNQKIKVDKGHFKTASPAAYYLNEILAEDGIEISSIPPGKTWVKIDPQEGTEFLTDDEVIEEAMDLEAGRKEFDTEPIYEEEE